MVIKDYKTVKTYGIRILDIPKPLANILYEWSKNNTTSFLIPTRKKAQMSQQGFTDLLNRIFCPDKVSTDILRQSYITNIVCDMEPHEAKKIATIMAHSITTQQMVYKKH